MSTITKEWLQQKIADMEATRDEIPFGLDEDDSNTLAAMKLALASLEAEAVITVGDDGGDALAYRRLIQTFAPGTKLYTAPPAPVSLPDYPDVLPCPVMLEPGLRFGKGVHTKTVLDALQRRAEYYADLEAMTPEERAEHDAGMKEFAAMLQGADGNSPVIPDGWVVCSERMPEQFKAILAFNEYGEVWSGAYDRYWNFYCDNLLVEHVTHWMPLPAAPQQEA